MRRAAGKQAHILITSDCLSSVVVERTAQAHNGAHWIKGLSVVPQEQTERRQKASSKRDAPSLSAIQSRCADGPPAFNED